MPGRTCCTSSSTAGKPYCHQGDPCCTALHVQSADPQCGASAAALPSSTLAPLARSLPVRCKPSAACNLYQLQASALFVLTSCTCATSATLVTPRHTPVAPAPAAALCGAPARCIASQAQQALQQSCPAAPAQPAVMRTRACPCGLATWASRWRQAGTSPTASRCAAPSGGGSSAWQSGPRRRRPPL
jgi:hypothetical protein